MKISKVTYTKVVQIKQYEPVTISMEAVLEDGDNAHDVTRILSLLVDAEFKVEQGGVYSAPPVAETIPKKVTKKKATKKKVAKKVEVKVDAYDRGSDKHKQMFIDLLDEVKEGWRETPSKAKSTSITLEGKPFINSKTLDVLPEFKEQLLAAWEIHE